MELLPGCGSGNIRFSDFQSSSDQSRYDIMGYGIADSIKVQELEKEKRNEIIVSCLEIGTGLRQLSRLTGVTYGVINKLNKGR